MSGRHLNILLVEDNPDHAELVRRSLEDFHVASRLHHVEDGETALDYIFGRGDYADRRRFPAPDLVLLDLRLPRMDGLEVLRHVKCHPVMRTTPVVVLTTSDAERDVAMAYEHQANNFVTKPVNLHRLAQVFADLGINGREWKNNAPPGPGQP
jgi:CheY-like chemotaxis protein